MLRSFIPILLSLIILGGCVSGIPVMEQRDTGASMVNEPFPAPDPQIQNLLNSYRDSLNTVMGERIATIQDTLRFGQPESALGNIVADAIRFRAGSELGSYVHIGVIGEPSFKLYLEPGSLTVGEILEFMPYNNHLVVLNLTGNRVAELANQIAATGGGPVSGLRFRISNGSASGILVNSTVLDRNASYLVATSSWAADGGDRFSALWDYTDRIDLNVGIRDLYIDYFKSRGDIYPVIDGRIRR